MNRTLRSLTLALLVAASGCQVYMRSGIETGQDFESSVRGADLPLTVATNTSPATIREVGVFHNVVEDPRTVLDGGLDYDLFLEIRVVPRRPEDWRNVLAPFLIPYTVAVLVPNLATGGFLLPAWEWGDYVVITRVFGASGELLREHEQPYTLHYIGWAFPWFVPEGAASGELAAPSEAAIKHSLKWFVDVFRKGEIPRSKTISPETSRPLISFPAA